MKIFITLFLTLSVLSANCQTNEISKLVSEGVTFHDNGNYDKAIEKYKEALKIDNKSSLVNY